MTQRSHGKAALAAVWTMVRVSPSGVQMQELVLDTRRNLKMVAAEGCVCPAGEVPKTFHNEVVHVSPPRTKCPKLTPWDLYTLSWSQLPLDITGCPGLLSSVIWLLWCRVGCFSLAWRSTEGCSLPGQGTGKYIGRLFPARSVKCIAHGLPHEQRISQFGSCPASYHCV